MKYLQAVHSFVHQGKSYNVKMLPNGEVFINQTFYGEYVQPNTTKTRALAALREFLKKQPHRN
jgi:hypothetical protein